jgi:hypothetical protein
MVVSQQYISAVIHTALLNNVRKVGRLVLSRTSCCNIYMDGAWPKIWSTLEQLSMPSYRRQIFLVLRFLQFIDNKN